MSALSFLSSVLFRLVFIFVFSCVFQKKVVPLRRFLRVRVLRTRYIKE